jgi:hypothetical protein
MLTWRLCRQAYPWHLQMGMWLLLFLGAVAIACFPEESYNVPPRFSAEQRRTMFRPGPVWDDTKAEDRELAREQLTGYADRALYWLGDQHGRFNLQPPYGSLGPQDFRVIMPYGQCVNPKTGQTCEWRYAATVGTYHGCFLRPEMAAANGRGKVETVRGGAIMVQVKSGEVYVWTGDVRVIIFYLVDVAEGKRAVEELRGTGQVSGHIGPGDPLPPPDFSRC